MNTNGIIISAKVSYQPGDKDWYRRIERLAPLGHLHLAPKSAAINPQGVAAPFRRFDVAVSHIHAPRISSLKDLNEALPMLAALAAEVKSQYVLFHPFEGRPEGRELHEQAKEAVAPWAAAAGLKILWETDHRGLPHAKRCASELGKDHYLCYDFNHCFAGPRATLDEVKDIAGAFCAFHVSNCVIEEKRKVGGLPAFDVKGEIDFPAVIRMLRERQWTGIWDLEYHKPYRDDPSLLLHDAEKFKALFSNER